MSDLQRSVAVRPAPLAKRWVNERGEVCWEWQAVTGEDSTLLDHSLLEAAYQQGLRDAGEAP